ncbi:hypothetical protein BST61_g11000 [Cercospora zeina]
MLKPFTTPAWRICLIFSVITAGLLGFASIAGPCGPLLPCSTALPNSYRAPGTHSLASLALDKVLQDASPIFGHASSLLLPNSVEPATATWMKAYHDDTRIVHLNLPGAHDAATWNYSRATQDALKYVNDLANISAGDPAFYNCQARSLLQMLNAGIRVFDLRYAFDVTRTTLVFWHGNALQSETATVQDVMYAFYAWLDLHPSEALFLSFQHEGGGDDMQTQVSLSQTLGSSAARKYIVQARGELGTLAQEHHERALPGLHFSPRKWTVNGADIELVYNETTRETAYIEDYFYPMTEVGSPATTTISMKMNATEAHLQRAASNHHADRLFWGFASSTNTANVPPDTPQIQALGNGTLTPEGGVNQQLVPILKGMKGKRLGIMMFDFFEEPEDLVSLYLSLLSPEEALHYGAFVLDTRHATLELRTAQHPRSYNPSVAAADELIAADEAVKQSLDDLVRHQQNHLRIQELRATSESLDETIKTTLRLLADARKDIASIPATDPKAKERNQQLGIDELLTYAKFIAPTTVPPTYRKPLKDDAARAPSKTPDPSSTAVAEAAGDTTAQISNGLSTPQAEDQTTTLTQTEGGVANPVGHKSMEERELAWLNPKIDSTDFEPWPNAFVMSRGALADVQMMVERGEDPKTKLSKEEQAVENLRRVKEHEEEKARKAEEERRAKEMFGAHVQRRGTVVEGFNPDDL